MRSEATDRDALDRIHPETAKAWATDGVANDSDEAAAVALKRLQDCAAALGSSTYLFSVADYAAWSADLAPRRNCRYSGDRARRDTKPKRWITRPSARQLWAKRTTTTSSQWLAEAGAPTASGSQTDPSKAAGGSGRPR